MSALNRGDSLIAQLAEVGCRGRSPLVMGILNVTPDSFSDGGHFDSVEAAARRADKMIAEGAEVVDVGPESTRPGSEPVPVDEQIRRAVPVIDAVRQAHPAAVISIDTQSASVAAAALDAGADVVNDISALRQDEDLVGLVASRHVPVVVMHMLGQPKTMQSAEGGPTYADVVREVRAFLSERIEWAVTHGIARRRIIVDPGLGFGKTLEHNLALMRRLAELADLNAPLLVGASRKSFIGELTGVKTPQDRLGGSLACAVWAAHCGAAVIRTHDVGQTVQALQTAWRIDKSGTRYAD